MPEGDYEKTVARLMAISAVGTEMVLPIAVGVGLDIWLKWMPWCSVIGAIFGLIAGITHLVVLNRPKPP